MQRWWVGRTTSLYDNSIRINKKESKKTLTKVSSISRAPVLVNCDVATRRDFRFIEVVSAWCDATRHCVGVGHTHGL